MPRYVDNVVNSSSDPDVAISITSSTITSKVVSRIRLSTESVRFHRQELCAYLHVRLQIPLLVFPYSPGNRWPGVPKGEDSLDIIALEELAGLWLENAGLDAEEGDSCRTWLGWNGPREGRDHDAASLSLPECVDDGALLLSDMLVVPVPGFRIDGLSDGSQDTQRAEVVALNMVRAKATQQPNSGGRRVELGKLVLGHSLPVTRRSGIDGS